MPGPRATNHAVLALWRRRSRTGRGRAVLRERHFALAAVAASQAPFAKMVIARILGALRADPRGFLSTNAARERHGLSQFFLPEFGDAAGCVVRMPRQRCASRSITSN